MIIVTKKILVTKTNSINKIEKLALRVGQESTVDSLDRFKVGWLAKMDNEDIGGIALFGYDDGFVIDYISPVFDFSNILIIEKLIKKITVEANKMNYFPLTIVRDKKDLPYFVHNWGFKEASIDDLPYIYKMRTKKLCNECDKYLIECFPVVFQYNNQLKKQ